VEKILEVGDQHSIVKTFFVTVGVQNIGIAIAILVLFLLTSNFYKLKIRTVSPKSSILIQGTKKFHKKNTKISKRYARIMEFHNKFGGGGSQRRGWYWTQILYLTNYGQKAKFRTFSIF
jgi:hypothetical protein